MLFELEHHLDSPPEKVAAALLDPSFQDSLRDIPALADREVLSQEKDGDSVVRRVRCVLDIDVNGVAKKFLGNEDPAWVEVASWDPARLRWSWVIEPEVAADLLEASGSTSLEADGSGTVRRVEGEVKVRVPFYGGKVEGWIVEGLEHAYEEEAERLTTWLSTPQNHSERR